MTDVPRTRCAKAPDGAYLAYQVFGEGTTELLYVPGRHSHLEVYWELPHYARFMRRLAKSFRVITFDKRGIGMSERGIGAPDFETMPDDVRAVFDAAGSPRPVVWGDGADGGGSCAVSAASFDRVLAFIWWAVCAQTVASKDFPWGQSRDEVIADDAFIQQAWGDVERGAELLELVGCPSLRDDPAARQWIAKLYRYSGTPNGAAAFHDWFLGIDVRAPAATPARSSCWAPTSAASACTSAPGSALSRHRLKSWSRQPSRTSSPAPASLSKSAASTRSKACPGAGACTRQTHKGNRRRAKTHVRGPRKGGCMTRIDAWPGTTWNGQGQTRSLPQDWLARTLARVPLFEGLSKQDLQAVAGRVVLRQYAHGVTVVHIGARADGMHVVLDGGAVVQPAAGKERRLEPGDFFGELALIDGAPRAASVVADGELTTAKIGRVGFHSMLREEPLVAVGLLPGLVRVIRDLQASRPVESTGRISEEQPLSILAYDPETRIVDGSVVQDERDLLGWRTALRHVPLFEALPERHLRQVARRFAVRRYGEGRVVVRQDAKGGGFFLLLAGRVSVAARDGASMVLDPGAQFGELALIDGAPRSATVTALDQVTVAELPRTAFRRLLQNEPRTAVPMIGSLVALIRELQGQTTA